MFLLFNRAGNHWTAVTRVVSTRPASLTLKNSQCPLRTYPAALQPIDAVRVDLAVRHSQYRRKSTTIMIRLLLTRPINKMIHRKSLCEVKESQMANVHGVSRVYLDN